VVSFGGLLVVCGLGRLTQSTKYQRPSHVRSYSTPRVLRTQSYLLGNAAVLRRSGGVLLCASQIQNRWSVNGVSRGE
jgi:hypothetical protein